MIDGAVRVERGRPDIVVTPLDAMFFASRTRIASQASKHPLPVFYQVGFFVDGGLISYGPKIPPLFRRAALFVDRILKGAKPADLPARPTDPLRRLAEQTAAAARLRRPLSASVRRTWGPPVAPSENDAVPISEILWPEERVDHIAQHGVRPEELEEVFRGVSGPACEGYRRRPGALLRGDRVPWENSVTT